MTGRGRVAYLDPDGPEALGTLIGHTHGGIHACGCDLTDADGAVYALRLDDGRAVWASPRLVRRLTEGQIACWTLRLASPEYRAFVHVTSLLGIAELDRLILNSTDTLADVLNHGAPKDTTR